MSFLKRFLPAPDFGLLVIRVGLGAMMVYHGYPKLTGGPTLWNRLGGSMASLGIHDYPTFWGFMAAIAETVGGLLLIAGFLFQPACLFLVFTLVIASLSHFSKGEGLKGASHAIETGFAILGLFFTGPGKYAIQKGK